MTLHAMTEPGPGAVPRRGSDCAAPRCARGSLRCSLREGGCDAARSGAGRAIASWLLAGPSPAATDFPSLHCAPRRPRFAPTGYRPRARETLLVRLDKHLGAAGKAVVGCASAATLCGAEERRAHGRARTRALQHLTRRDCSSAANAVSVASFAAGHEIEHRKGVVAKATTAVHERRRIPARGFARSLPP